MGGLGLGSSGYLLGINPPGHTDDRDGAQRAIDKWYVVGLDMFGRSNSARDERYIEWGLKKRPNGQMREQYIAEMDPKITALGLVVPNKLEGRRYL